MKTDLPGFPSDSDRIDDLNLNCSDSKVYTNRNSNNKNSATYLTLGLATLAAIIAGSYAFKNDSTGVAQQSQPLISTPTTSTPVSKLTNSTDPNFIATVVQSVGPAVVRIDSTQTVTNPAPAIFQDPFFRQFFGSEIPTPPTKQIERGIGSGFIINPNGEILTNAHVVKGADTVTVTLKNGRSFKGSVMGSDPVTDIAVVKIQANNLPIVALGDSSQIKPGDLAIAIGNPLGLDNTVTSGIISATGRGNIGDANERVNFIQTDAAINPGNSGGPLLNSQGQAIGMNTAIIQDAQGIGFAIPINQAKSIAQQLIANGSVKHPYLGIQMVTLNPEIQQSLNNDPNSGITVDTNQGVLVAKVLPNSPAARAGLRAGDVIQKINGQLVPSASDLQQIVEENQVGSSLELALNRHGQPLNLSVQTAAMPVLGQQRSQ